MSKIAYLAGALYGFSGVVLGAFGAHAWKARIGDAIDSFHTGDRYQIFHALLLILIGILLDNQPSKWLEWSAVGTITGVLLFSGSIYLLTVAKLKAVWFVTPIGGFCLIVSWCLLLVHFFTMKQ